MTKHCLKHPNSHLPSVCWLAALRMRVSANSIASAGLRGRSRDRPITNTLIRVSSDTGQSMARRNIGLQQTHKRSCYSCKYFTIHLNMEALTRLYLKYLSFTQRKTLFPGIISLTDSLKPILEKRSEPRHEKTCLQALDQGSLKPDVQADLHLCCSHTA